MFTLLFDWKLKKSHLGIKIIYLGDEGIMSINLIAESSTVKQKLMEVEKV